MINHQTFSNRLKNIISLPSVSCTDPEIDTSNLSVVELLATWFETLGFEICVQEIPDFPGKFNLIANYGKGDGGLVLAGHTDTVPYDESRWQQDPFSLTTREDRFYGLGVADMKGFFPVVLAALENVELNKLSKPLTIIATADEESSMSGARALAESENSFGRFAVIGEPTSLKPIRMHKGIMMECIRIQGLAGHSSNPKLGQSALEAMNKVMGLLIDYRREIQARYHHAGFEIAIPTLNLGCIHGGDNPNRICGHCELQFDLRPLPGMDLNSLHEAIDKLLRPLETETETTITLEPLFPGVQAYEEPETSEIVSIVERLSGFPSGSAAFATEAPFLQKLGMQTVVMGPGSIDQAHQPNEFLAHSQIDPAVELIEKLVNELCR